jgi:hypothetical protein
MTVSVSSSYTTTRDITDPRLAMRPSGSRLASIRGADAAGP